MRKIFLLALLTIASITTLSACGTVTDVKQQAAQHIARPAFMVDRTISAGQFGLSAWERMHQRQAPATIYIEGDSITNLGMEGIDKDGRFGFQSSPCLLYTSDAADE